MKKNNDHLIIGFALFAMFFGAGNLIFPPQLGRIAGSSFLITAIGFITTGVGLPLLAIIACTKYKDGYKEMTENINPKFSIIFSILLFTVIGPLLAIPRTAATTHEMLVQPLIPNFSPLIFMFIYFGINLLFVLRPSKIIDIIGKYLTPTLLFILSILIIKGIFLPIGDILSTDADSLLSSSLIEGYQTMDALSGLVFASIIAKTVKDKGYSGQASINVILKSGIVAIVGLAIIYCGLMFLGAQTTSLVSGDINKTALLVLIAKSSFGDAGTLILGICISIACLTTSIGLISAVSEFFNEVSKNRISYKFIAITTSIISIIIGSFGVDHIVSIANPVLNLIYPVAITLIITSLLKNKLNRNTIRITIYASVILGIITTLPTLGINIPLVNQLPLSTYGFGWVLPTIFVAIIAFIFNKDKTQTA